MKLTAKVKLTIHDKVFEVSLEEAKELRDVLLRILPVEEKHTGYWVEYPTTTGGCGVHCCQRGSDPASTSSQSLEKWLAEQITKFY